MWSRVSVYLNPYWRRLLQTEILPQKASRRRVKPELIQIVRTGLHEDGNVQFGEPDRVGDSFFVAEVRQADRMPSMRIAIGAKEFAALDGVCPGFHGAEFGVGLGEPDRLDLKFSEQLVEIAARFGNRARRERNRDCRESLPRVDWSCSVHLDLFKVRRSLSALACVTSSQGMTCRSGLPVVPVLRNWSASSTASRGDEHRRLQRGRPHFAGADGRDRVGAAVEAGDDDVLQARRL